jgi:hypothetical protein
VPSVVWASVFLLLVLLGSIVGCFGMIGMPISAEVQVGLLGGAVLLAGFGWLLLVASPNGGAENPASAFHH